MFVYHDRQDESTNEGKSVSYRVVLLIFMRKCQDSDWLKVQIDTRDAALYAAMTAEYPR